MSNAITIEGLTKTYGKLTAVDNLSLEVPRGAAFAFLGPNGAGKSTTLKILTSLIKPTSGEAFFFNINALEEPQDALLQVGAVVETAEFYPSLTPNETLEYFGRLRGMKRDNISKNSRKLLLPFILLSQAIPIFALAPILTLWLGYGIWSKVIMTMIIIYLKFNAYKQ